LRAKPARPIAGTMGVLTIRQFSLNGLVFLAGLVGARTLFVADKDFSSLMLVPNVLPALPGYVPWRLRVMAAARLPGPCALQAMLREAPKLPVPCAGPASVAGCRRV
jgi:hypothetical protein